MPSTHSFFSTLVQQSSGVYDSLVRRRKKEPSAPARKGLKPLRLCLELERRQKQTELPRDIIRKASAPSVVFGPYSPISPDGPTTISVYSPTGSSQLSLPLASPFPSHVDENLSEQQQFCVFDEEADADASWDFKCAAGSTKVGSENKNTNDGEESGQLNILPGVECDVCIVIEAPLENSKAASSGMDNAGAVAPPALGPDSAWSLLKIRDAAGNARIIEADETNPEYKYTDSSCEDLATRDTERISKMNVSPLNYLKNGRNEPMDDSNASIVHLPIDFASSHDDSPAPIPASPTIIPDSSISHQNTGDISAVEGDKAKLEPKSPEAWWKDACTSIFPSYASLLPEFLYESSVPVIVFPVSSTHHSTVDTTHPTGVDGSKQGRKLLEAWWKDPKLQDEHGVLKVRSRVDTSNPSSTVTKCLRTQTGQLKCARGPEQEHLLSVGLKKYPKRDIAARDAGRVFAGIKILPSGESEDSQDKFEPLSEFDKNDGVSLPSSTPMSLFYTSSDSSGKSSPSTLCTPPDSPLDTPPDTPNLSGSPRAIPDSGLTEVPAELAFGITDPVKVAMLADDFLYPGCTAENEALVSCTRLSPPKGTMVSKGLSARMPKHGTVPTPTPILKTQSLDVSQVSASKATKTVPTVTFAQLSTVAQAERCEDIPKCFLASSNVPGLTLRRRHATLRKHTTSVKCSSKPCSQASRSSCPASTSATGLGISRSPLSALHHTSVMNAAATPGLLPRFSSGRRKHVRTSSRSEQENVLSLSTMSGLREKNLSSAKGTSNVSAALYAAPHGPAISQKYVPAGNTRQPLLARQSLETSSSLYWF